MLRFAITDRFLFDPEDTGPLIARCAALAQSGIDYLLIREKDLPTGQLVTLCRAIRTAVQSAAPSAPTQILVSNRPDIALAANLDGVHLSARPGELTPAQVRQLLPNAFISISCHTLAEVRQARQNQASAILFAPIFGKVIQGREVTPSIGLEALAAACQQAHPTPVLALGGITEANTSACLQAGAAGIAAIRLFFSPTTSL